MRLATVVQWLQESQSLPRVNAVDVLCSKLDERVLGALCRIQSGVFAVPVAHDSRFGFKASKPAQMSAHLPAAPSFVVPGYLSSFSDRPRFTKATRTQTAGPARPDVAPGLPALLARLRLDWRVRPAPKQGECDPLNDKGSLSAFLALPFGLAHELWGWGVIAAPSGAVLSLVRDERPAPSHADTWTPERLAKRRQELDADGQGKPMQRLAKESGIDERKIRHHIKAWREAGAMGAMAGQLTK